MSGSRENATTSALSPESTARLWSPEAPYDSLNFTFFPAGVAWNALMIFLYAAWGVEYATSESVTVPAPADPLALALPQPARPPARTIAASAATVRVVCLTTPSLLCRLSW